MTDRPEGGDPPVGFDPEIEKESSDLLEALRSVLAGSTRSEIVERLNGEPNREAKFRQLRQVMSDHAVGDTAGPLARLVRRADRRTRSDGFRVLHTWNHRTHAFTDELAPVLLVDLIERSAPENADDRVSLAILLDYYLLHILTLCATRIWDASDPDRQLDRVGACLGLLQGEAGSGHQFVENAESLIIYALSQFHPEEQAYDRVIDRVETLSLAHQLRFACASAAVLGAHLRWGFWLMYERDVVRMRADNEGDYPWLFFCATVVLRAFADFRTGGEAREKWRDSDDREWDVVWREIVCAVAQVLMADPYAFDPKAPRSLGHFADRQGAAWLLLEEHGQAVIEELRTVAPQKNEYSPLSLHFNFPHNVLVALVTLALLESVPQRLPLNALLTGTEADTQGDRTALAQALMAFSGGSPDRLGHRGALLVAYDPLTAMRSFAMAERELRRKLAD